MSEWEARTLADMAALHCHLLAILLAQFHAVRAAALPQLLAPCATSTWRRATRARPLLAFLNSFVWSAIAAGCIMSAR